jgi:CO/xanthine dehydrogenase FAD-binding subunit
VTIRFEVPASPAAAFALLAGPAPAAPLAGGTDLLFDLDRGPSAPSVVVSLRRLPWRDLRWEGNRLYLGATRPLADIERDARVRAELPGLRQAIRSVGAPALRTRATFGGNLARAAPASDLLPIALALEGEVELERATGSRRLPIAEFLVGSRRTALAPGELIRGISLAALPSQYLWQRVRPANDVSQVGVAVAHRPDGPWRIALGGVQPCARRIPEAERALPAAPAPEEIAAAAEAAAEKAPFASDRRATEQYRRQVVRALVARAVGALATGGAPR